MPDSARERYRRAALRLPDRRGGRRTGHAAMFQVAEVVGVGDWPDGGGFPLRFLDFAHRTLGCRDPSRVLHVCSGSVLGALTVDRRLEVRPSVVADARQLPFADESVDWVIADPPYSREWAKALYGITARQYPTPGGIVREAMRVLRPGGRLGLLHYMVPPYGAGVRLVGIWGIALGPGSSMRAWTVLEREPLQLTYVLDEDVQAAKEGAAPSRPRRAPRAAPPAAVDLAEEASETAASPDIGDPGLGGESPEAAAAIVARDETQASVRDPVRRTSGRGFVTSCAGCGVEVEQAPTGRPRRFCSPACREAARRRREQGLAEAVPRIPRTGGRARLADRLDEVAGADPEDQEGVRR